MKRIYIALEHNSQIISNEVFFSYTQEEYEELMSRQGTYIKHPKSNKLCLVHVTEKPLWLNPQQQDDYIFHIIMSHNITTYTGFWKAAHEYFPDYANLISNNAVMKTLKWMYDANVNGFRIYPNIKKPIELTIS